MADPVSEIPARAEGQPAGSSRPKAAAEPRRRLLAGLRRYRRVLLLVVLPTGRAGRRADVSISTAAAT